MATAGYSKCEGVQVGSATVPLVCKQYALQRKPSRLNWRVSSRKSAECSLGWIPFKAGAMAKSTLDAGWSMLKTAMRELFRWSSCKSSRVERLEDGTPPSLRWTTKKP
jgi:ribosomal protein L24E